MKRIFFSLLLFLCGASFAFAQTTTFKFQDGIANGWLKSTMENRISSLLTEIGRAGRANRQLSLAGLNLSERSLKSLKGQWETFHFICEDEVNVASCLEDVNGYEVRGIPVAIKPLDNDYTGSLYKELVIRFDKTGVITSIHMALDNNVIMAQSGSSVTDAKRRREILNFVEEFRSYYDEKDIRALDDVFSEDALIITGTVVQRRNMGRDQATLRPEIRYKKQNKEQYLSSLRKVFANNKYIKVKFDSIKVSNHPAKYGFYDVTLRQKWTSDRYSDDGYVYLMWEFPTDKDGKPIESERPRIHVRTWQPEWGPYDPNGRNRKIKDDEIFDHDDFFIP